MEMINAIGEVNYEAKERIDAAYAKFNELTDAQKALVSNFNVLAEAQTKIGIILADKAKADEVDAKIDAIGDLVYTSECKEKIDTAKASYNVLSESQKNFVTKFDILISKDKSYEKVDYAYKVINAIGTVELNDESKQRIANARNLYNELSDEEKNLITNSNKLVNAEDEYKQLSLEQTSSIVLTVVIVALVVLGILIIVGYILLFFVFNSWTLIRYKQKRVFKLGVKNGKIRLLKMNLRIIYRDEADVHRKK